MDIIESNSNKYDGMYPIYYDNINGGFIGSTFQWGSLGDSAYEYFIKQYLLTNKTEKRYRRIYDKAINSLWEKIIKKIGNFTYISDLQSGKSINKMEHLACFAIGMLVIGAEGERREKDLNLAKELGKTCYNAYSSMLSGLSPDSWYYDKNNPFRIGHNKYLLRPETVEGLFYLYRETGNQKYREWGWNIFKSLEKHCKSKFGYSTVSNVDQEETTQLNKFHSFYLAETLKYLYLLFSPKSLIPLDKYVFNTEAHPLEIYNP